MKYLLDTNPCIRYLNGRVPRIRERLLALDEADIAFTGRSIIVIGPPLSYRGSGAEV